MPRIILALALITTALPAVAGGFAIDFPTLTWPTTVTVSTQNCQPAQTPCK